MCVRVPGACVGVERDWNSTNFQHSELGEKREKGGRRRRKREKKRKGREREERRRRRESPGRNTAVVVTQLTLLASEASPALAPTK